MLSFRINSKALIISILGIYFREAHGDAADMCLTNYGGINWCPLSYMLPGANLGTMGTVKSTVDTTYTTQVYRVSGTTSTLLPTGSTYVVGETLKIKLSGSPSGGQIVYQATGTSVGTGVALGTAHFTTTSCCFGYRFSSTSIAAGASFLVGTGTTGDINFWLAWSQNSGTSKTFITNTITLVAGTVAAAPTASPVAAASPTATPTAVPLSLPTVIPSAAPVANPTAAPSIPATVAPSSRPTASPSAALTMSPTASPTDRPSSNPTVAPSSTAAPTVAPSSAMPSSAGCDCGQVCAALSSGTPAPTILGYSCNCNCSPTPMPTKTPTPKPSAVPTAQPTQMPSFTATSSPSVKPSFSPSTAPSKAPSNVPTSKPTKSPTSAPTCKPTRVPTLQPTTSASPTLAPVVPTGVPTSAPTMHPTLLGDRFVVQATVSAVGMTAADFTEHFNDIAAMIAGTIGIDQSQIYVVPSSTVSGGAKKASRVLDVVSVFGFTVDISDIGSAFAADKIKTALSGYLHGFFFTDLSGVVPSVTSISVASISQTLVSEVSQPLKHSCRLSLQTTFSWTKLSSDVMRIRLQVSSGENWVSFGIIKPAFLMVPSAFFHNVFIFAPDIGKLGRYDMVGITAKDMTTDTFQRQHTVIANVQISPKDSFIDVDWSTTTEGSDVPLNIAGVNYITWANGAKWPEIHTDYGFTKIDWAAGTCEDVQTGASAYWIFVVPMLAVASGLALKVMGKHSARAQQLMNKRLPFLFEYSWSGSVLIAVFLAICVYVFNDTLSLYPEITTGIWATGKIGLMGFWMALLPAGKASLWIWFTGIPFERALKYHKNAVSMAMGASAVHLILTYMKDQQLVTLLGDTYWRQVNPAYGLVSFCMFGLMSALAFEPIRRARYEIFLLFHQLYPIGILFLVLHVRYSLYGFLPGIVLHGLDTVKRLYQWANPVYASITADKEVTCVDVRMKDAAYIPGGYYFLNIPSVSSLEWHPISISSKSAHGITFHVKALGDSTWTRNLYNRARNPLNKLAELAPCASPPVFTLDRGLSSFFSRSTTALSHGNNSVSISLDGPYGSIPLPLHQYTTISILCGGIGVTPMISMIEYILDHRGDYSDPLQIDLHWAMRGRAAVAPFEDRLRSILHAFDTESESPNPRYGAVPVRFTIYDTEKVRTVDTHDEADQLVQRTEDKDMLHPHFKLLRVRPDTAAIIASIQSLGRAERRRSSKFRAEISDTLDTGVVRRGCLLVCGPMEMTRAAGRMASVAGIDFHTETFAF